MNKFEKRYNEIADGTGKRINFLNPTISRESIGKIQDRYVKVFGKGISMDKIIVLLIDRAAGDMEKELADIDEKINGTDECNCVSPTLGEGISKCGNCNKYFKSTK